MTATEKTPEAAQLRVPHEIGPRPGPEALPGLPPTPCANCGAPRPTTSAGRPRLDAIYCGPACRREATRVRRAAAREEVRAAIQRLVPALRTLGVLPSLTRPSPRRSRVRR